MPGKMIFFLVVLAVVVFFAGFNITNVSDISFGFYTITDVPIFISLFIAFVVGTLVMIPFVAKKKVPKKKKKDKLTDGANESPDELPEIPEVPILDESESPRFKKSKKK